MWVESHQSLRNHPKVKKAARLAGINEFEMIGRLHCLWWWAIDYAPDGDISKYSTDDIESAVDWDGKSGALYSALINCGFNGHCGLLERIDDQTIVIHDWHEYGGKLLEKREANKERMREKRATHVQRTTIARTGATEDKITEDNNTEKKTSNSAKKTRATPPQVEAYRRSAHRYPNKSLYDLICQHVKDDEESLSLFERVVTGWIAMGWNPANINGILEFVDRGEIPHKNGKNGNSHHADQESTGSPMMDAILRAQKDPNYGK